jgi:hypothetical protein
LPVVRFRGQDDFSTERSAHNRVLQEVGMSGSGGGGDGGFVATDVACSALSFNTQVATPNPMYVDSIEVGIILAVELLLMGGQQVVAVMRGTDRIGGLAGAAVSRLRDCLVAGTKYRATVTRAHGPHIVLRIEPLGQD